MKKWIFYSCDELYNKTIHCIKQCKNPERTKVHREMMHLLGDKYDSIGCMTVKCWNKENQCIKISK